MTLELSEITLAYTKEDSLSCYPQLTPGDIWVTYHIYRGYLRGYHQNHLLNIVFLKSLCILDPLLAHLIITNHPFVIGVAKTWLFADDMYLAMSHSRSKDVLEQTSFTQSNNLLRGILVLFTLYFDNWWLNCIVFTDSCLYRE